MESEKDETYKLVPRKMAALFTHEVGATTDFEDADSTVQWLQHLHEDSKVDNPLRIKTVQGSNRLAQLVNVLRECLLAHRWREALEVFSLMIFEPHNAEFTTARVGFHLMYTEIHSNSGLLSQMFNQQKNFGVPTPKEVSLEYMMYLLCQNKSEEAIESTKNLPKLQTGDTLRNKYVDILFEAYLGLLWYQQWLILKQQLDHYTEQMGDQFINMSGSVNQEEVMKTHAQKAMKYFEVLKDKPGVWDIFILKHVQLLEYYDLYDEALQVLQDYRQKNSENPNSHVYTYEYACRQNLDVETKLDILKALAAAVPSHPLVLELCDLLIAEDDDAGVLAYLFDLLDYACWQDELVPWKKLHMVLLKTSDNLDPLTSCWESREAWWPEYQFSVTSIPAQISHDDELITMKAAVATCVLGAENEFSKIVQSRTKAKDDNIDTNLQEPEIT